MRPISAFALTALLGCAEPQKSQLLRPAPEGETTLTAAEERPEPAADEPLDEDVSDTAPEEVPPSEPAAPQAPKSKMTFFVTSTGTGTRGGNLGGLVGADKKCANHAKSVKADDHTWQAYVSVGGINAKDRIGKGPWYNQKGKLIAENVEDLHALLFVPMSADMIDEKGAAVPKNRAKILTGTTPGGTAAIGQTCDNWTSASANRQTRVGDAHVQSNVAVGARWNDATESVGCSQAELNESGGDGRLYCFAID
jgi:hypothetical protein